MHVPRLERPSPARLSVVVPCLDEAPVLRQTCGRLVAVLGALPDVDLEVVLVDDGSDDGTPDVIRALNQADDRVVGVLLSRRFGQQQATSAGLRFATGDAVVVMDADLQDPPEVVEAMLAAWREGADVAFGQRRSRQGEAWWKRATASVYYRVLARLSDVDVPVDTGDFRLMDRRVVDALLAMPEQDRFLRGMVAWLGFRQVAVPFDRAPRAAGRSKYALGPALSLAIDGMVAMAPAPLRGLGLVASALVGLGLGAGVLAVWWASVSWAVLAAVLGVGGLQLGALAVIGEYVARTLREVRGRPSFVVREVVGVGARASTAPRDAGARSRVRAVGLDPG